ncbi:MAG: EamA family transporter [Candidatus Daviesbacteria bacterium]|nr:EamA family transporter [Candidatus Daviesbacteria bacterium]
MTSQIFTKSWPYTAIILAHLIWGVNFVVVKLTIQEIPPMSLAFIKFTAAALLLLPFLIISGDAPWTNLRRLFKFLPQANSPKKDSIDLLEGQTQKFFDRRDTLKVIAVGVLMITLNTAFFFLGLERTTVSSASILTLVIPIISILIGWAVLKEKVYVVNVFGVLAGLFGTIAVLGIPLISIGAGLSTNTMIGNFLIILAAVCWVIGALFSKQLLQKYSTLTISFLIFCVGSVTFLIPAINEFIQNPTWYQNVTYLGMFGVIYMTLASSICGYFLFTWSLDQIGVAKADFFQYLEPVVAISLGILTLGEELRYSYVLGAILIMLGAYWSTLAKTQHKHPKYHRH